MAYPALPNARRMHYEIDGTIVGYNKDGGYGTGLSSIFTGADMLTLDEEMPSVNAGVTVDLRNGIAYFFMIFPELVDISNFICRTYFDDAGGGALSLTSIQGSTDTTTGADGTWNDIATSSGSLLENPGAGSPPSDWWRSVAPAVLSSNNTGLRGLRFSLTVNNGAANSSLRNLYIWGKKHAGQTPDDVTFLKADGITEWPNDDDWGDIAAGSAAITHTYYVKNTSGAKTANAITVKASGSDNAHWTVSLDNVSFASSKPIAALAPGATQVVYVKFTPPSPAGGVYRPYAMYLEADVTSWT